MSGRLFFCITRTVVARVTVANRRLHVLTLVNERYGDITTAILLSHRQLRGHH